MTNSTRPLVTVYIATRNRQRLLLRALSSIMRQRGPDIEILVVDDASDDGTPGLLRDLARDGTLRWYRFDQRMGACAARNHALREARGFYVTGLDDDDEMLPGRVAALLAALRPEDAFVCASDLIVGPGPASRVRLVPGRIDREQILSRNVVGNQILAERSKVLACGGYDESLPAAQDYDLWIRMIWEYGPARGKRRPLQRIHAPNWGGDVRISTSPARRRGYWMAYLKHREKMSRSNRRAHLYNLRRANGRPTRLPFDFMFFTRGNRLRLLWHALRDAVSPHL